MIVFAWILLARIAQAEGACQKADALDIACKIATKVDREISALRFALQVFTTYRSIDSAGSPSCEFGRPNGTSRRKAQNC